MAGGLGHHVVMTVGAKYLQKGHHFYQDNLFTSIELAESLLDLKTRSCGTIRMNRKGWPNELKINKIKEQTRLETGDMKMMQLGEDMVASVWQDKRTIAVLSTKIIDIPSYQLYPLTRRKSGWIQFKKL